MTYIPNLHGRQSAYGLCFNMTFPYLVRLKNLWMQNIAFKTYNKFKKTELVKKFHKY